MLSPTELDNLLNGKATETIERGNQELSPDELNNMLNPASQPKTPDSPVVQMTKDLQPQSMSPEELAGVLDLPKPTKPPEMSPDDLNRILNPDLYPPEETRQTMDSLKVTQDAMKAEEKLVKQEQHEDDAWYKTLGKGLAQGYVGSAATTGSLISAAGSLVDSEVIKGWGKNIYDYWSKKAEKLQIQPDLRVSPWENPGVMLQPEWLLYHIGSMAYPMMTLIAPGAKVSQMYQAAKLGQLTLSGVERIDAVKKIANAAKLYGALTDAGIIGATGGASTFQEVKNRGGSDADAGKAATMSALLNGALGMGQAYALISSLTKARAGWKPKLAKAGNYLVGAIANYLMAPSDVLAQQIVGVIHGNEELKQSLKDNIGTIPVSFIAGALFGAAGNLGKKKEQPISGFEPAKLKEDAKLQNFKDVLAAIETPEFDKIQNDAVVRDLETIPDTPQNKNLRDTIKNTRRITFDDPKWSERSKGDKEMWQIIAALTKTMRQVPILLDGGNLNGERTANAIYYNVSTPETWGFGTFVHEMIEHGMHEHAVAQMGKEGLDYRETKYGNILYEVTTYLQKQNPKLYGDVRDQVKALYSQAQPSAMTIDSEVRAKVLEGLFNSPAMLRRLFEEQPNVFVRLFRAIQEWFEKMAEFVSNNIQFAQKPAGPTEHFTAEQVRGKTGIAGVLHPRTMELLFGGKLGEYQDRMVSIAKEFIKETSLPPATLRDAINKRNTFRSAVFGAVATKEPEAKASLMVRQEPPVSPKDVDKMTWLLGEMNRLKKLGTIKMIPPSIKNERPTEASALMFHVLSGKPLSQLNDAQKVILDRMASMKILPKDWKKWGAIVRQERKAEEERIKNEALAKQATTKAQEKVEAQRVAKVATQAVPETTKLRGEVRLTRVQPNTGELKELYLDDVTLIKKPGQPIRARGTLIAGDYYVTKSTGQIVEVDVGAPGWNFEKPPKIVYQPNDADRAWYGEQALNRMNTMLRNRQASDVAVVRDKAQEINDFEAAWVEKKWNQTIRGNAPFKIKDWLNRHIADGLVMQQGEKVTPEQLLFRKFMFHKLNQFLGVSFGEDVIRISSPAYYQKMAQNRREFAMTQDAMDRIKNQAKKNYKPMSGDTAQSFEDITRDAIERNIDIEQVIEERDNAASDANVVSTLESQNQTLKDLVRNAGKTSREGVWNAKKVYDVAPDIIEYAQLKGWVSKDQAEATEQLRKAMMDVAQETPRASRRVYPENEYQGRVLEMAEQYSRVREVLDQFHGSLDYETIHRLGSEWAGVPDIWKISESKAVEIGKKLYNVRDLNPVQSFVASAVRKRLNELHKTDLAIKITVKNAVALRKFAQGLSTSRFREKDYTERTLANLMHPSMMVGKTLTDARADFLSDIQKVAAHEFLRRGDDTKTAEIHTQEFLNAFLQEHGDFTKDNKIDILNPRVKARYIRGLSSHFASFGDKITEFWKNSILSGLSTIVQNPVSNVLNTAYEFGPKGFMQALSERILGEKTALKQYGASLSVMNPATEIGRAAFAEALNLARETFDTESPSTGRFGMMGTKIDSNRMYAINFGGRIVRVPYRLLNMGDEFQKMIVIQAHMAMAARDKLQSRGVKKPDAAQMISEMRNMRNNPYDPVMQQAISRALDVTFQMKPGNLASALISARNNWPILEFVLPFIVTPGNIIKTGLRRSPLGALRMIKEAVTGKYENLRSDAEARKRFSSDIAEQSVWVLSLGLLSMLDGIFNRDDDKWAISGSRGIVTSINKAELLRAEERRLPPMTIRLNGVDFNYSKIAPLNVTLPIIADILYSFHRAKDGESIIKATKEGVNKMLSLLQDQSMVGGIFDLVEVFQDPTNVEKYATNMGASFVPNIFRQMGRTLDPYKRESRPAGKPGSPEQLASSVKRAAWNLLPSPVFASSGNKNPWAPYPQVDPWGRELTKTGRKPYSDFMWNLLNSAGFPVNISIPDENRLNKMIWVWNNRNRFKMKDRHTGEAGPEYFFAKPDHVISLGTRDRLGRDTIGLTDKQYYVYCKLIGKMSLDLARKQRFNIDNPTIGDMIRLRNIRVRANAMARNQILRYIRKEKMA